MCIDSHENVSDLLVFFQTV